MKLLRYTLAFCICLSLGLIDLAAQSIPVSLSDETGLGPGTTTLIPVYLDEAVTSSDGISGIDMTVGYDASIVDITGIETENTLTEDWSLVLFFEDTDEIGLSHTNPIEGGPGVLFYLEAEVQNSNGSAPITFDFFSLNEGNVSSITTDGNTSVGNDLVITEVHADPASGLDGDANGDGVRDSGDDEFVEIVNIGSSEIDLSGYVISDGNSDRFTFPSGTTLAPGLAATVFGGGEPTGIPGAVFTASSLGLNNGGDTITLKDASGAAVDAMTYGSEGGDDQSLTRSPNAIDPFVQHLTTSSGFRYSPGQSPDGSPLPVELTSFNAVTDGGDVTLRWRTATETNNSGFEIQQRTDQGFTQVGFVEGAGTTAQPQSYQYQVQDLDAGTYIFRLKQVDFDGTPTYTRQVEVTVALDGRFNLGSAYPNPFQNDASFSLQVRETQEVRITVYNALGQQVREVFHGTMQANSPRTFTIEGSTLPSGMYLYRAQGRTFSATRQIMRVK